MRRTTTALTLACIIILALLPGLGMEKDISETGKNGTRANYPGLIITEDIVEDTVWNMEVSHYFDQPTGMVFILNNISVVAGVTLTIEKGVSVFFGYRTSLNINGTLIVKGEPLEQVKFAPYTDEPSPRDWKGIYLWENSRDCSIDNLKVSYADGGISTIGGNSPFIANSTFEYCMFYGINSGAMSRPTIINNNINFTEWAGIICNNGSYPIVEGNSIVTCYYGIVCYDMAEVNDNEILTCWIGIICWGQANVTRNEVRDCMDGIHGFYSSPRIEENYIVSCDGNGTRFMGSDAIIRNNTLRYNQVGMDISYDAKEILDNMENNYVNGIEIKTCFFVDQDDMVIDGLEVDSGWSKGYYGTLTAQGSVTLYDCSNVTFRNCNITNSNNAIYATNSSFKVFNTHFNNTRKGEVHLDANATGQSYNGSVDPERVNIGGSNCLFVTYDDIRVAVEDYHGEPVPDTNVVISESQLILHNVSTGDDGHTGSLLVKDSTVSEAGVISSPLSIRIYTEEYNFQENPMTGVYVRDTELVTFKDLGDIFPPVVSDISVKQGERTFPVNGTITITFNEPMNRTSVENAFSISGNVSGNFTWSGFNLTFTPDSLEYRTDYLVLISQDAEDQWGNNMEEPVSFSFTTASEPGTGSGVLLVIVIAIFALAGIGGYFIMRKMKATP